MKKIIFILISVVLISCEKENDKCISCNSEKSLTVLPCSTGALGMPNVIYSRACSLAVSNTGIFGTDVTVGGVLTASNVVGSWNGISNFSAGLSAGNVVTMSDTNSNISSVKRLKDSLSSIRSVMLTSSAAAATYQPIGSYLTTSYAPTWTSVTGKPSFATVATTGAYSDLSGSPTIPTNTNQLTNGAGYITNISGFTTDNLSQGSTNKYYTDASARLSLSVVPPMSYNNATGVFSIQAASGSQSGYISSSDWTTFNSKISTISGISAGGDLTGTFPSPSLAASGVTAGSYGSVTVNAKGIVTAGKRLERYVGITNASGEYTVTYSTSYGSVPNVQPVIRNQSNDKQFCMLTSSTTSGFTVKVVQRNSLNVVGIGIVLLETVTNVNGSSIDVIVTE